MATATHYSSNVSASIRRISPRPNATLRANGAKIAVPVEDNVKSHCKRIEEWIA